MTRWRSFVFVFLLLTLPLLSACATVPTTPDERAQFEETNDPMEPLNRAVFDVNDFIDRLLFRPLAELYRLTTPSFLRNRISGIVLNMKEPVIFANNLMQGKLNKAGITLARFGINTTAGIGGMWDVAGHWEDLAPQTGDFGQTLFVWGFGDGPYTVLPFFGPSSLRDKIGLVVDTALSPWQYLAALGGTATFIDYEITSFAATALIKREQNIESVDALREGSIFLSIFYFTSNKDTYFFIICAVFYLNIY